jgi:hypothetical protein
MVISLSPMVILCTIRFNTKFYVLPEQWICVFCTDLRTSSDYFTTQQKLVFFT